MIYTIHLYSSFDRYTTKKDIEKAGYGYLIEEYFAEEEE